MTRGLLFPRLVCVAHVWQAVCKRVDGHHGVIADATDLPEGPAMVADLLAQHAGDPVVIGLALVRTGSAT